MTQCNSQLELGFLGRKQITGAFDGGEISSDGGLVLVAQADKALGLTAKLAAVLSDRRQAAKVRHPLRSLFAQRIYQIACGYEDCNDADDLRRDPVFKTCIGRPPQSGRDLASQPTLSRFENSITATALRRLCEVLVDAFISQHRAAPPRSVVLDFDSTDDPTHGQQQLTGFHGYYREHCYLPLIVTAQVDGGAQHLLAAVLRPGRSHASRWARAVLARLVGKLRAAFPQVRIVFRADSGFALPELYDWCEDHGVQYLLGIARNPRLAALIAPYLEQARAEHEQTGEKVRHIHQAQYAAETWRQPRRVLLKAEVMAQGDNPRFVVTNLVDDDPEALYGLYAARGEMENRIKELKADLQIDRTSCHRFAANGLRLILHAAAFVLLCYIRTHLAGTRLASAQVGTLQRSLLKLGVRVKETARRVWLQFATSCPVRDLWPLLWARMRAAPA